MPFVLMQFTFAHACKLVTMHDLAGGYDAATLFLVPVMLVSTLLHFFLIAQMSIEFVRWARKPGALGAFLSDPASNTGIFSPMVALGMTVNVVLGPVAFFLPEFSEQVPTWVAFGIYPYALLFLALVAVSLVVAKTWFFRGGQAVAFKPVQTTAERCGFSHLNVVNRTSPASSRRCASTAEQSPVRFRIWHSNPGPQSV